ncbi:hypothetical protein DPEC_G00321620 [Dallia pectoralis]|uniref:Uncharacterized protein n=1 Tax=Dallia pectoralis TaxID=75939 RepID=A0ACC2FAB4_DALPE|nr:hypothetical protein DPEC_G00321620 [Dallia pectoralis]
MSLRSCAAEPRSRVTPTVAPGTSYPLFSAWRASRTFHSLAQTGALCHLSPRDRLPSAHSVACPPGRLPNPRCHGEEKRRAEQQLGDESCQFFPPKCLVTNVVETN